MLKEFVDDQRRRRVEGVVGPEFKGSQKTCVVGLVLIGRVEAGGDGVRGYFLDAHVSPKLVDKADMLLLHN